MSKYGKQKISLETSNNSTTKIINLVGKNKKVLDFGCSSGYLGKTLIENSGCKVWGLEVDPVDAKLAEKYYEKVILADLETENWFDKLLTDAPYDVAVFADILEHLKNPKKVLALTKKLLSPDGYILVSIPNIANVSVRLELLFGSFEYEKYGILDNTHVHFYTKNSLVKMVENVGYFVDTIDSTSNDFSKKTLESYFKDRDIKLTQNLKKILTEDEAVIYQFILKAILKKPINYKSFSTANIIKPKRYSEEKEKELLIELKMLEKEILTLQKEVLTLQKDLLSKDQELEDFYKSKAWKMVQNIRKIKNVLKTS